MKVFRLLGCPVLAAACAGWPPPAPAPPRNAIVILVDTLRADHLGLYGRPRGRAAFRPQLRGP